MRNFFSTYLAEIVEQQDDIVFITGDLGYAALEPLAAKMGNRFINAGVAEQGMISIAAGMAAQGYRVICYSIAPFVVYRCLEQIRNDACFHNLPVYVVGNGGGYGYGIMGASHHAIEDIGTLSCLPNMRCYVPAFTTDLKDCMDEMLARRSPAYLRLGLGKQMSESLSLTEYGAGSKVSGAAHLTVVAQSPVANNVIAAIASSEHKNNIDLFLVNRMPFTQMPADIKASIAGSGNVLNIEEHVSIGGLGSAIALLIAENSINVNSFISLRAEGYPGGLYGNQSYHQQMSGIDEPNILRTINTYF